MLGFRLVAESETNTNIQLKAPQLTLFFSGADPQLYRTEFFHPLNGNKLITTRGKTGGAYKGVGSLQWTSAVQAFALLAVLSRCYICAEIHTDSELPQPTMRGLRGSKASSLDYAISKRTNWLLDIFGIDAKGIPILRRVFNRSNPDGKRSEPIVVALNRAFLPYESINIVWNEVKLCKDVELNDLSVRLKQSVFGNAEHEEGSTFAIPRIIDPLDIHTSDGKFDAATLKMQSYIPYPFNNSEYKSKISEAITNETINVLWETDIFNKFETRKFENKMYQNSLFARTVGKKVPILSDLDRSLDNHARLGLIGDADLIKKGWASVHSLRVAIGAAAFGAIAILNYLKSNKHLPIEIDYRFDNTRVLISKILTGELKDPPQACIVSISCAAFMLREGRRIDYLPLMVMPRTTHRIITKSSPLRKQKPLTQGEYLFVTDGVTTSSLYMDDLLRNGHLKKRGIKNTFVEQDEITHYFKSGTEDLRAIIWFPHYIFNKMFNNSQVFDVLRTDALNDGNILFLHKSVWANHKLPYLIDIAIRDAWIALRTDRALISEMLEPYLNDASYLTFLARTSGLHNFSAGVQRETGAAR